MKKLFYGLSNSPSLIGLILKSTVAVAAFAVLEVLFVQQAHAGIVCCTNSQKNDCICDSSLSCNITKISKVTGRSAFYGTRDGLRTCWNLSSYGSASQIKSTITCENVNEEGTTTLDPTSFTQSALLKCEVTDSLHDDVGLCQFDLQYSRSNPDLRTCTPAGENTIATWQASCTEATGGNPKLTVAGTLKCPASLQPSAGLPAFCDGNQDCILNLGIDGVSPGQCPTVFPEVTELNPTVPAGEVLNFSQTLQGSCTELDNDEPIQVLAFGSLETNRYCSSGLFANAPGLPVDCTPNQGPPLTGLGLAASAISIDVKFAPTSLNINCGTNNNDTWHFTITANQHLTDLTRIVPESLAVEGVSGQVTCDTVTSTAITRTCHINACQPNPDLQDLATVVCNGNPKGRADLTVTGNLDTLDGIPIFGEDLGHKTTGQCRALP